MDRRGFINSAAAAGVLVAGASRRADAEQDPPQRRSTITHVIDASAHEGEAQIWVPLIQTARPYQRASPPRLACSGQAQVLSDDRYGAKMVRARWSAAGPKTLSVTQTVETRDRGPVRATLNAAERRAWLQPTASIPTDGVVRARAMDIVGRRTAAKEKVRAIYDWIVDNTFRDPQTRGCGLGDVRSLLESGRFGGKCADLNSLMTGLCRAAGVPARDVYGVRFAPSAHQKSLGTSGPDVSHAQHCRSEVWLETAGWFPVDPADVRKVVLEAGLPVDSPVVKAERERLFGSWEMNWVGYNSATDLGLPGAPRPMEAHFLMYPYGMTPTADLDWLSPDLFSYKITSQPA